MKNLTTRKIMLLAFGALSLIFLLGWSGSIGEEVNPGEIVVIQAPISGTMTVYTQPGWVWQNFGTATHYKKSFQFWFSKAKDQGDQGDQSIKVRFNDGGHANVSGSVRVDLPLDAPSIIQLHTKFGSQEAIETQCVRTVIEKSIYMTGPLMSSAESYAEKRNSLLSYIEDQAMLGVYKTRVIEKKTTDPLTGQDKTVSIVELVMDGGNIARQEKSPLAVYGLKLSGLSLNSIDYDPIVEKQIATQQNAIMQVQTAIANSKKAEQDALTSAKQGEADATKAKWTQEIIKAKLVTEAEQKLAVQKLATQTADLYKQQQILEGEGDAKKQQLMMQANGNLDAKLDAWLKSQQYWADAFSKYQGAVVPQFQMGNGTNGNTNGATNFMEMMGMKAMKDLSVDVKAK